MSTEEKDSLLIPHSATLSYARTQRFPEMLHG